MRVVLGLAGYSGAGKDALASVFVDVHGWRRVAFADELKAVALAVDPFLVGPSLNSPGWRLAEEVANRGWSYAKRNPEVRRVLQRLGVAMRTVDPHVWLHPVLDQIDEPGGPVVVPDVRFDNEVDLIRSLGGSVAVVRRPGVGPVNVHSSEELAARPTGYFDLVVDNDGDLDLLAAKAEHLRRQAAGKVWR